MSSHPLQHIQGFIFDLDGTLVTSTLDFIYLKSLINCPPSLDILSFIKALPIEQQAKANNIVEEYERQDAQDAVWIDGVKSLIDAMQQRHLPMAIVTRNCRLATHLKLAQQQVFFTPILTRHDAPPKPDPSGLLHIARQWRIPVKRLAYVGDYLYDVQAANNAGMLACLYAPDKLPEYASQAGWVFTHFDAFLDALSEAHPLSA